MAAERSERTRDVRPAGDERATDDEGRRIMTTMTRRLAAKGLAAGLVAALARGVGGGAPSVLAVGGGRPVKQEPLRDDVGNNLECVADPQNSNTYICTDRNTGQQYECTYYPSSEAWF